MMNLQAADKSATGFSLIESVIVIACMAIVASMAAPDISHLLKTWTLWGSARSVENSLQWGRMTAIATNSPLIFEVEDNGRSFGWKDPESGAFYRESERKLSEGICITSFPKQPLRFYPRGNAAPAGTFVVEGEAGSCSVVVSPGGRIRFQKN